MWINTLANLRVLFMFYQTAHWSMKGQKTYQYHLLFERLLNVVNPEIDQIAEKSLFVNNNEASVNYKEIFSVMELISETIPGIIVGPEDFLDIAIRLEESFVELLNQQLKDESLSEGTKNLVAQIADNHEQNLYLLKFQK
jgi:DNA-binding ferritin-like protein